MIKSKFINKYINKHINYILLTIIFMIIFIISCYYSYLYYFNKLESFTDYIFRNKDIKYYRCQDKLLGKITQSIFDEHNIINSNEDWDLYYPCGYNNIEKELKGIQIINNYENSDSNSDLNSDLNSDSNSDSNKELKKNNINAKFIFGINGCDRIVSKNNLWTLLESCYGREKASKLIPESFVLNDNEQLNLLKKNFYENKNSIYILKKNVQRKEGLKLTKNLDEIIYAKWEGYILAQKYMSDIYLINNRKVNLRIYVLIMIKNNKIHFYVSRKGKCIYTNKEYNDNDFDFETNITSYNLDMSVYEKNPRFFEELIQYINKNNGEGEGQKLFEKINYILMNIFKCIAGNIYQSKNIAGSVTFQLFGIDVIFNKNLDPYLLEFNKGPDMQGRDEMDEKMKTTVQTDMFKTVGVLNNDDNTNNSFYLLYNKDI